MNRSQWKYSLFSLVALACLGAGFLYWRYAVYPFLDLAMGHVSVFTEALSSEAAGKISEMGPQEGDLVRRGELLFALDRGVLMSRKQSAEMERRRWQEILSFEQDAIEKALESYLAQVDLPEEANKYLTAMQEAQARAEGAKEAISKIEQELRSFDAQMAMKAYVAPFDGVVLKRNKTCGVAVPEGEEIYRLADPRKVWIETSLAETELSSVAVGMKARVRLPAYRSKEWSGVVSWIGPATLEGQKRVGVRIAIDDPDSALKPGLSAAATVRIH